MRKRTKKRSAITSRPRLRTESLESRDMFTTFPLTHSISDSSEGAFSVHSADLDQDGDLEVLVASHFDDKFSWFDNLDGQGNFGVENVLEGSSRLGDGAIDIETGDIDADGKLDIVVGGAHSDTIAWYRNLGVVFGKLSFASPVEIYNKADYVESIQLADMDNDGDLDVVATSYYDNTVAWHRFDSDTKSFEATRIVASTADSGPVFGSPVDFDQDGDQDILVAAWGGGKITWLENKNGAATSWTRHIVAEKQWKASSVASVDIDNDGDLDIVSSSYTNGTVTLHKNTNGRLRATTLTDQVAGARSISISDYDQDGDPDIIVASLSDDRVSILENRNEQFILKPIAFGFDGAREAIAADLDSDGDLDVLAAAYNGHQVMWIENRAIGDANNDGVFSSGDLVAVFQAGEYEDGSNGNSTFSEGDWNNDGDFDTKDLVAAFATGKYADFQADKDLGNVIPDNKLGDELVDLDELNRQFQLIAPTIDHLFKLR